MFFSKSKRACFHRTPNHLFIFIYESCAFEKKISFKRFYVYTLNRQNAPYKILYIVIYIKNPNRKHLYRQQTHSTNKYKFTTIPHRSQSTNPKKKTTNPNRLGNDPSPLPPNRLTKPIQSSLPRAESAQNYLGSSVKYGRRTPESQPAE